MAAARELSRSSRHEVILFDRRDSRHFLPLLPDVIGRGLSPALLQYSLPAAARQAGFRFVQAEVTQIDLAKRSVVTADGSTAFDRLIVASGSETDFHGDAALAAHALRLDDADDARNLDEVLDAAQPQTVAIAGGGYTGVEIASNLWRRFHARGNVVQVLIVEKAPRILGSLPPGPRDYAVRNLQRMGVAILTGRAVASYGDHTLHLDNGDRYTPALLIWTAGGCAPRVVRELDVPKAAQSRIKVASTLQFREGCFAVGDAAAFEHGGMPVRMAIQFAIVQGQCAARNILRAEAGQPLQAWRPVDLGYVVPMANNRSCGRVLGLTLYGVIPTALHYALCLYRTEGIAQRRSLMAHWMRRRQRG